MAIYCLHVPNYKSSREVRACYLTSFYAFELACDSWCICIAIEWNPPAFNFVNRNQNRIVLSCVQQFDGFCLVCKFAPMFLCIRCAVRSFPAILLFTFIGLIYLIFYLKFQGECIYVYSGITELGSNVRSVITWKLFSSLLLLLLFWIISI